MRRLNFHIAARWRRRDEARAMGSKILQKGHGLTSRWLQDGSPAAEDNPTAVNLGQLAARRIAGEAVDLNAAADSETIRLAAEAIEDVDRCDALILLTESSPASHNLRIAQAGYALGRGKRVYLVGQTGESLLSQHPKVIFLPSLDAVFADLHSRGECRCADLRWPRP